MNKITFWFRNARPISLPQSMLPALTAVALSAGTGNFSWIAAVVCVIGVMFAHLGMNLLDDWFDYYKGSGEARKKAANEGFRGRMTKYPYLTSGEATPKQLQVAVCVFLGIAAVMGCIVLAIRGWMILWWMLVGFIIGYSYSGGPLKLGFRGLVGLAHYNLSLTVHSLANALKILSFDNYFKAGHNNVIAFAE